MECYQTTEAFLMFPSCYYPAKTYHHSDIYDHSLILPVLKLNVYEIMFHPLLCLLHLAF